MKSLKNLLHRQRRKKNDRVRGQSDSISAGSIQNDNALVLEYCDNVSMDSQDVRDPHSQPKSSAVFTFSSESSMAKGRALDDSPSMQFLTRDYDDREFVTEISEKSPPQQNESSSIPEQAYATELNVVSRKLSTTSTHSDLCGDVMEDVPDIIKSYANIPLLEQTQLPRGGVSMETNAVGRVQFGIPPETIKDSMRLGLTVPSVYIVPIDRFCREMGPALGVNLAEFEFPAYFNFFVHKKQCTLIVDSDEAEQNIRRVFSETLLGPEQFRREKNPISYEEEDFAPDFPRDAIPDFQKEFKHFRIMPDGKELVLETLLRFCHFETSGETGVHENLGVPPPLDYGEENDSEHSFQSKEVHSNLEGANAEIAEPSAEEAADTDVSLGIKQSRERKSSWKYTQARWVGDVATVWAPDATPQQIAARSCKRVEIFKMPGGTEYILHDIDENNFIVGKARFSGNVKVSESMGVDGFGEILPVNDSLNEDGDQSSDDDFFDDSSILEVFVGRKTLPPSFNPPSFGVTILGNSHGFDKSGSVSGYVLWINGRGVMIDPPPYSSATLEREGIRPRTIVGIILTHCHADHDAGAFQKVLTGSPVVVITTPTIYKSFIRKYAALSALSPALLRHSHRHKPAIIGSPLRFQGATFHFTYTLHTIPCVGFRVDWRGRSMVFTGDHFNFPPAIDKLQESGVLSKARADDLRNLPLQETDLLLHEAGAPPIHTPLDVLVKLPQRVKKRMYVVHTSALPEGCDLRVAPTGTAGTIRLDQLPSPSANEHKNHRRIASGNLFRDGQDSLSMMPSPWGSPNHEYDRMGDDQLADVEPIDQGLMHSSFSHMSASSGTTKINQHAPRSNSVLGTEVFDHVPPLVAVRPASSTDAWFILNLLSAVPFLSSLSYASTMEVLETARVDAYCKEEIIVPAARRNHVLCVVWEGTCVERKKDEPEQIHDVDHDQFTGLNYPADASMQYYGGAVWHAGDWTGPIALQPEKRLSGESSFGSTHDVVAMSSEGVKVISIEFSNLHAILRRGSTLYRKYLERRNGQKKTAISNVSPLSSDVSTGLLDDAMRNLNVLELLDCNSAMRKLSAVQKRHLESLVEGPVCFQPGERLWRAGAPVEKAFIVVSGTVSFVPKRRNAGSVGLPPETRSPPQHLMNKAHLQNPSNLSLGESMRRDAMAALRELRIANSETHADDVAHENLTGGGAKQFQLDTVFTRPSVLGEEWVPSSLTEAHDYAKLSRGLQKRADIVSKLELKCMSDSLSGSAGNSEIVHNLDTVMLDLEGDESAKSADSRDQFVSVARRRSSRARFANKVLGRLYSRRAFTGGLVFSIGHFLGDVSKMMAGLLSNDVDPDLAKNSDDNDEPHYGFGEKGDEDLDTSTSNLGTVHEQEGNGLNVVHSSTLIAGKDGCVVLVFMKASLIPFLDEYPGFLLSLLGTQAVV